MKPILFNQDMVKAILDEKKSVTRRLIKDMPDNAKIVGTLLDSTDSNDTKHIGKLWFKVHENDTTETIYVKFPYQVGDILYVRETWSEWTDGYVYKVPDPKASYNYSASYIGKWHPSLHMPKEAARIFLKVTNVRVERLQDMNHDEPSKEGIRSYTKDGTVYKFAPNDEWLPWSDMPRNPTKAFELLWNSTIKKTDIDRYGWDANPWVWVIEFERVSKEESDAEGN